MAVFLIENAVYLHQILKLQRFILQKIFRPPPTKLLVVPLSIVYFNMVAFPFKGSDQLDKEV